VPILLNVAYKHNLEKIMLWVVSNFLMKMDSSHSELRIIKGKSISGDNNWQNQEFGH